jgi:hypothetical protein
LEPKIQATETRLANTQDQVANADKRLNNADNHLKDVLAVQASQTSNFSTCSLHAQNETPRHFILSPASVVIYLSMSLSDYDVQFLGLSWADFSKGSRLLRLEYAPLMQQPQASFQPISLAGSSHTKWD